MRVGWPKRQQSGPWVLVEGLVEPCGRDGSESCQVGGTSRPENSCEAKGKRGFARWVSGIHRYSNKATSLLSGRF